MMKSNIGTDGITARFLQQNWEIVGSQVCKEIKEAFESARVPANWSQANIVLLPKCSEPRTPRDFRPLSIGNVLYRLFMKIITTRLQPFIAKIVSPEQTTFIRGQNIMDNTILLKEVLHSYQDKRMMGRYFALKADINKAFDTIE
jgi:Reverse transcriptase (RNA-dependent DNA polymerase)